MKPIVEANAAFIEKMHSLGCIYWKTGKRIKTKQLRNGKLEYGKANLYRNEELIEIKAESNEMRNKCRFGK